MPKKPHRSSRVPTGRLERLARIGWMTGEFALGGASEGFRRILGVGTSDANVFLNPLGAERLALHLSRMRGAAMKVGQMLSLVDDRILPPEFASALEILRASADQMPESQVRKTLQREYGAGWETRFQSFDFEPIAAASIGQVHMATDLQGHELALKIQYPGIAESIDSDVDNLATALFAARILPGDLDLDPLLEEAKRQLHQESDYQTEAKFLRRYREAVAADSRFAVPDVIDELTTTRVLAMERMYGLPLEDLAGRGHSQELRDRMGARLVELLFKELFEWKLIQTDPNFSNYLLMPDGETLGLLDFGSTIEIDAALSAQYVRLFRAFRENDRDALHSVCLDVGYLRETDSEAQVGAFLELLELIGEPFTYEGDYAFGESDFVIRARDQGIELAFQHGFLRAPPPKTLFPQRKIDGILMLCGRIGARVNVPALLDPFLVD